MTSACLLQSRNVCMYVDMRRDVLSQVKRAEQSDQVSGAARFNVFAYVATHQSFKSLAAAC